MFITLWNRLFYSQFISCACKSAWHIVRTRQVLVEWMNPLEPILRNVLRPLVTLVSETMICSSQQGMQMWIVTYLLKATSNISPYLVLLLTQSFFLRMDGRLLNTKYRSKDPITMMTGIQQQPCQINDPTAYSSPDFLSVSTEILSNLMCQSLIIHQYIVCPKPGVT